MGNLIIKKPPMATTVSLLVKWDAFLFFRQSKHPGLYKSLEMSRAAHLYEGAIYGTTFFPKRPLNLPSRNAFGRFIEQKK